MYRHITVCRHYIVYTNRWRFYINIFQSVLEFEIYREIKIFQISFPNHVFWIFWASIISLMWRLQKWNILGVDLHTHLCLSLLYMQCNNKLKHSFVFKSKTPKTWQPTPAPLFHLVRSRYPSDSPLDTETAVSRGTQCQSTKRWPLDKTAFH